MKETIGLISGILVAVSVIPYAIRTYQRKIRPNAASWSIWTLLGLAILLTYKSSGATTNIWPAVFGFINPLLITILVLWRGEKHKPTPLEVYCAITGIGSIILWWFVQGNKELSVYALCLALIADTIAAIPTIIFVWKTPEGDRPFAWGMFVIAYGIVFFAIKEHTFSNYILPIYMVVTCSLITFPLIRHRIKNKSPAFDWI